MHTYITGLEPYQQGKKRACSSAQTIGKTINLQRGAIKSLVCCARGRCVLGSDFGAIIDFCPNGIYQLEKNGRASIARVAAVARKEWPALDEIHGVDPFERSALAPSAAASSFRKSSRELAFKILGTSLIKARAGRRER